MALRDHFADQRRSPISRSLDMFVCSRFLRRDRLPYPVFYPRLGEIISSSYRSLSADNSSSPGYALTESGSSRHIDRSVTRETIFNAFASYTMYFFFLPYFSPQNCLYVYTCLKSTRDSRRRSRHRSRGSATSRIAFRADS